MTAQDSVNLELDKRIDAWLAGRPGGQRGGPSSSSTGLLAPIDSTADTSLSDADVAEIDNLAGLLDLVADYGFGPEPASLD